MSGALLGLALRGVHGVSLRAKTVLLALVETCHTANSPAFPGTPRIAAYFGIGQRQVREALAELERLGWTRRIPGTGHGPGNPAKYLIDFTAMRGPAEEFERTRGETCFAAKAANVGTINAAHLGRKWTDEKRRNLRNKASHVLPEMRRTGDNEPEGTFEPKNKDTARQPALPVALFNWVPEAAWERWKRHRGRKLTPEAVRLQMKKLDALRKSGHELESIIDHAIESGWATFYPPKSPGVSSNRQDRREATAAAMRGDSANESSNETAKDITAESQLIG